MAQAKTNAMRILEKGKVPYTAHEYPHEPGVPVDGVTVARLMGQDPARVFKTLVAQGAGGEYFVFVIPAEAGLDLKKAARAVGEKSIAMIRQAELLPLTGYVHGGCSPIGMKKLFPTVLDQSAQELETMVVSGGRIGTQVELSPGDLAACTGARFAPVSRAE